MVVAGDFEAISIPFAAGTAIAALIAGTAGAGTLSILASTTLMVSAVTLWYASTKGRIPRLYPFTFLLLGMFCFFSYSALPHSPGGSVLAERAAHSFASLIDSIPFSESSTSALLKALLIGDRSGLDRSLTETFRQSGASHILALSGLHMGIIYLMVSHLLSIAGNSPKIRVIRSATIIAVTGFYTIMTGGNASTTRAWLFIALAETIRCMPERKREPLRILLCALTIQLTLRPTAITELGFQLSYLAMCGIFLIHPRLEAWYPPSHRMDPVRWIWQSASLSISCQLFTAPLVWFRFHTFPQYFLICNLTALPMTTGVMICALGTVVLSAAGHCPEALIWLTESLVKVLTGTLEIICSM